jgi:hypothetical protein
MKQNNIYNNMRVLIRDHYGEISFDIHRRSIYSLRLTEDQIVDEESVSPDI